MIDSRTRSEIGGQVYDSRSGRACIPDPLGGRAVRERREDHLRLAQRRVLGCDISHFGPSNARALAPLLVGSGEGELEPGMPCDQPAQLPTRVPTRTKDADRNFMHKECITLHCLRVNDPGPRLAECFRRC